MQSTCSTPRRLIVRCTHPKTLQLVWKSFRSLPMFFPAICSLQLAAPAYRQFFPKLWCLAIFLLGQSADHHVQGSQLYSSSRYTNIFTIYLRLIAVYYYMLAPCWSLSRRPRRSSFASPRINRCYLGKLFFAASWSDRPIEATVWSPSMLIFVI